ncbi:MAG TPA: tetratricopeptide repeat protein [Candidatus Dormibacteraeota bacterium]|jgi:tetratricopeptide (TPR) repeat protein|nr:tetratricopeptide repeat protein [Candidatus Dormibacteraeota bacterium]
MSGKCVHGLKSNSGEAKMYGIVIGILACAISIPGFALAQAQARISSEDVLARAVESARITRDEGQLNSLKAEFEKRVAQNNCEARCYYEQARVQLYLSDVFDLRKDKKQAAAATDRGIDTALHSLQMNEKSADTHALLADLYAHRVGYGGMFAGPKYGPKINDEVVKGIALDDKNPRVLASQGRRFLMAPKMFGGDVTKAIETFQKSLELDGSQAETWSWLARAYKKQGDSAKANQAMQKAMQLEPQNPMVKAAAAEISH